MLIKRYNWNEFGKPVTLECTSHIIEDKHLSMYSSYVPSVIHDDHGFKLLVYFKYDNDLTFSIIAGAPVDCMWIT